MPAMKRFLGYSPLPPQKNVGEQFARHRTALGITQKDATRQIGVDPGTLALWERGERAPRGAFLELCAGASRRQRGLRTRAGVNQLRKPVAESAGYVSQ